MPLRIKFKYSLMKLIILDLDEYQLFTVEISEIPP